MCEFFSAVSNGKGKVLFFKIEDIQKIEKEGNKQNYDYNSHTAIMHYNGIVGIREDKWNKWEYNPETKELKLDGDLKTNKDDSEEVKEAIQEYLNKNGELYCLKIYKTNSGDWNSGCNNSGHWNSGNRNSGWNNSGDWNSGNRNSGNRNSGWNNSGDWNSGHKNSGDRNSGWNNSGDRNSGHWNSGDRNSGFLNSTAPKLRIFNRETDEKVENIDFPKYFYFDLNVWVIASEMSDEEKNKIGWYKTTKGYLKMIEYKEAWKQSFIKASKEDVAKTLELPNFDYKIFEEISGITKKMIQDKLNN